MGHGFQQIFRIPRLAYFGGMVFAVIIILQYFEFPYGEVISSLFSASKIHITYGTNITGSNCSTDNATTTTTTTAPQIVLDSNKSETYQNASNMVHSFTKNESNLVHNFTKNESPTRHIFPSTNLSAVTEVHRKKKTVKVVSISEMHDILVRNRASFHSMKSLWTSRVDQELLNAKLQIENASYNEDDHNLYPSVFRNISKFRRSYELMEKTLKVYIYKEGEKPIFHQPEAVMKGIYASEGWFMMQMKSSKRFIMKNPKEAHLFYIPYSSKLLKAVLSPNSHNRETVVPYMKNYIDMISSRYNFWNRTGGADHFLVACHDWGPDETREFMGTCIRAICNNDVQRSGFELGKDVSLPETNVRHLQNPLQNLGGKPPSKRRVFAFFAGKMHGYLRPILLRHWENKDPDMKIFKKLPKVKDDKNYVDFMKNSKFCICAKGSEVNSPRVVEAIFYECVPVIISDNFVPPFFEVLDWESFAVFVPEKDIPDLKNILLSIPQRRYLQMHKRVKEVQHHFLWHVKPAEFLWVSLLGEQVVIQMGHGFQQILGIHRFAYFGGIVFALIIILQYFEFPYGDVISSLFSASKIHITYGNNSTCSNCSTGNATTALTAPQILLDTNMSQTYKNASTLVQKFAKNESYLVHNFTKNESPTKDNFPSTNLSVVTGVDRKKQKVDAVSISEMRDILVHNRAFSHSMKPLWTSRADRELRNAKLQIENASLNKDDHNLFPSVFRNISIFRRSYELMEKTLKVYIYKEGEKPIFHKPEAIMKGIYASEGWFMMQMKLSKRFLTEKPKQAHLFYIPYSSKLLKETLSPPNFYNRKSLIPYLKNYIDMISRRYSFWNRTGGADHFLVACHDWAPDETRQFMGTCIRALCNTDVQNSGFELGKDVSLPETNVRNLKNPLQNLGGKHPSKRSVFAFFAGQMHGSLRPILLRHWENKDPDMKIFKTLPKVKDDKNYIDFMKNSKFCICAKGSQVNSARVVEAIFYECVPVIISDNYVPPFFELLDWESFAVFIPEKDIPDLKNILLSIPKRRYLQMHQRVKKVQKHFLWHVKPVKYDIFHMILHSIWYTRVARASNVNPKVMNFIHR